jgi:hypothetical protein
LIYINIPVEQNHNIDVLGKTSIVNFVTAGFTVKTNKSKTHEEVICNCVCAVPAIAFTGVDTVERYIE